MSDQTVSDFLQALSERISGKASIELTPDDQDRLLRLINELDLTRVDLEAQNEQLRRLSRELESSRNEFHDLFETAPVAFVTLNAKGVVKQVNASAQQLLGAIHTRVVGRGFSTFIISDDWARYYTMLKKITKANTTGAFQVRLATPPPETVHVHVEAVRKVAYEGHGDHWRLALFDVSVERRREIQLQEAFEQLDLASQAAGLGIWNYDLARNTAKWNAQLYRLLGLDPRDGLETGQLFFEFIHPDDRKGILSGFNDLIYSKQREINEVFRVIRADRATRWMVARGRIYFDALGRPERISGINLDITDRKLKEEALRQTRTELETQLAETKRVNEELSQYTYAVSHDLKEPLRAVRNYANFLVEDLAGTLTGEQIGYLEGLKTAVAQGDALIEDLLAYSLVGQVRPEKKAVNVDDLITEIRSLLALPPDVAIIVRSPWPRFFADRVLLRQILQNLVSNGVKFNRQAEKQIEIGCRTARGEIEIFVRDNGIGIAPQYHEQVFRIFQRLHTDQEYPGTGIGLAIVSKAAAKLAGSVRLASEPDKGSTFFIRLPLDSGSSQTENQRSTGSFAR